MKFNEWMKIASVGLASVIVGIVIDPVSHLDMTILSSLAVFVGSMVLSNKVDLANQQEKNNVTFNEIKESILSLKQELLDIKNKLIEVKL